MTPNPGLEELVNKLTGARVLVAGDLMLDTYIRGKASRISPEAPVPVVRLDQREHRLGGAANSAMNIAALGGQPVMIGVLGKDENSEIFLNIAGERGFNTDGIFSIEDFVTTSKVRIVADTQQIVRVDEELDFQWTDSLSGQIGDFLGGILETVDAIAISDYAKGFVTADLMSLLYDQSRLMGIPILVDPKPVNIELFRGCDLLKPNSREASELSGVDILDDETCDRAALTLMYEYSPRGLLITRGRDGMDLYLEEGAPVRIRTRVSHVYDVSGAGDTVLAILAMGYAKKFAPPEACRLAAAAASVAVTKPGTSTVSTEELLESVNMILD
jgi:D-beta-D-heptose 7-phosphate kinase/D-beta-D-heptose 1-phosphate adenosyltransferase